MGSFGFEAAVPPDADVSVKFAVPILPQPAAGASGQVDLSAYVSRPLPLGWMSRPSSWACQEPTNGANPDALALAVGAKTSAAQAIPTPASAIFLMVVPFVWVMTGPCRYSLRSAGRYGQSWQRVSRTPWRILGEFVR